jgi:hypothetical protein
VRPCHKKKKKKKEEARHQWLPPILLPSYSRGRNQEACSLKPAPTNSSRDPISKAKKITKKGWWSSSWCRCGVQTPIRKKKERSGYGGSSKS